MSNWINVNDRLPNHHETVVAFSPKGQCIVTFVDSAKMNEELTKNGYSDECVKLAKNPYYFVSQEIQRNTLKGVTHWQPLQEPPSDI